MARALLRHAAEADDCRSAPKRNLIKDYYDRIPGAIEQGVESIEPVTDDRSFSPGFMLPEMGSMLAEFFTAAEASWNQLAYYRGRKLTLLDLTRHPNTRTTKTPPSLLMIARAVEYIRQTGENIIIVTPTSGNKGIALRDAVERAITYGLVKPQQLRIAIILPSGSREKLHSGPLTQDPELRRLNPVMIYDGVRADDVKKLARGFVDNHGQALRDANDGARIWFSLDIHNYKVADAARAFFEYDVNPPSTASPRLHAHAVSSAYGLLGYNLGRDVLEAKDLSRSSDRPGFLLVQHLGTPDMVLSLLNGRVNRSDMPNYTLDEETGLYFQSTSLNFPRETFDPDEILDRTFYTHEPPTSPEMNSIIHRFGGNGIVVSLHECLNRYALIKQLLVNSDITIPSDPRNLIEWSLVMAFTGVMNAIDRNLIAQESEIVIHGSGLYSKDEFTQMGENDISNIESAEDIGRVLLGT